MREFPSFDQAYIPFRSSCLSFMRCFTGGIIKCFSNFIGQTWEVILLLLFFCLLTSVLFAVLASESYYPGSLPNPCILIQLDSFPDELED